METVKLIKRFGYRTAKSNNRFLVIPREWVKSLEDELCRQAQHNPDNHTTFVFMFDGHHGFYEFLVGEDLKTFNQKQVFTVWFTDSKAYFGTDILIGDY